MRPKKPVLSGPYIPVYRPEPAVYPGPSSPSFRAGQRYDDWVPNDFTVIHDGRHWHLIGITHPRPAGFTDTTYVENDVHEAEWQLFHAVSRDERLKDSLRERGFRQEPLLLSALQRPHERPEIWAPICRKVQDEYLLLYSPDPMRLAASRDLYAWTCLGEAFRVGCDFARDPNILEKDGLYHVIYLKNQSICLRTSRDLRNYGPETVIFTGPPNVALESPILAFVDGWYYLFYCIYNSADRVNGAYDFRTFVHAAQTLPALQGTQPIARLQAHAPELFQDEDGDWYLASVEWPTRGVSIAPLRWLEMEAEPC